MSREVVVVSGVRTAIGTFGGSLKDIAPTELAAQVVREALKRGLLLRPIGSVVYFMPPYVIEAEQMAQLVTLLPVLE